MKDYMTLAKTAYEGYCEYTNHVSLITGDQLPEWRKLPVSIQLAWENAVKKIFEKEGE